MDRGPQIADTLQIVRSMVEAGSARAVMGNHELNALAFHTPDPEVPGEHLRRRTRCLQLYLRLCHDGTDASGLADWLQNKSRALETDNADSERLLKNLRVFNLLDFRNLQRNRAKQRP